MFSRPIEVLSETGRIVQTLTPSLSLADYDRLTITDEDNQVLVEFRHPESEVMRIPFVTGIIRIHYFKENLLIKEDLRILKKRQDLKIQVAEDREKFDRLKAKIQEELDMPKGSKEEKERHTDHLKNALKSKNARLYLTSKIAQLLLQTKEVDVQSVDDWANRMFAELYGMGPLQELDDDAEVGEILVNARTIPYFACKIYYYKNNQKHEYTKHQFTDIDSLLRVFNRAIAFSSKSLNSQRASSIEEVRTNGDRVSVSIPNSSINYTLNIRKFGNFIASMENLLDKQTINEEMATFLRLLVRGKANLAVGGEMNSGKTQFTNALLTATDPMERKVIITSTNETNLDTVLADHDIVVLRVDDESERKDEENRGKTFAEQLRFALRTTASRIIVPESRGKEMKQVYEANLKTSGNMVTAHALSDESMMDSLTDMYLESVGTTGESSEFIKNKIAQSFHIVVIMQVTGTYIRVVSLSEVIMDDQRKYSHMNPLFYWEPDKTDLNKGRFVRTDHPISARLVKHLTRHLPEKELEPFL